VELDSIKIKFCLDKLSSKTIPKWGLMNSSQMLYHCNTFIEVSNGTKKVNFISKIIGRLFGNFYLKSLDLDILNFKKNSATLKIFKSFPSSISFIDEKEKLIKFFEKVQNPDNKIISHQLYGNISNDLFRKLVNFHTSYHFNQFGILSI